MADTISLHWQDRDVVFDKSKTFIALRARAGMAEAMQVDLSAIVESSAPSRAIGAFEVIGIRPSAAGFEQDLDRLRARPSVAAASHVYIIKGETDLLVPNGHLQLRFAPSVKGREQQAMLARYRLQTIEERGGGEYLVRITLGSKNPLATAAALQAEPGVTLAEPEFVGAD